MKIRKMPLGVEPKRLTILCVLVALLGYLLYTNVFSSSTPGSETPRTAKQPGVLKQAMDQAPYTEPKSLTTPRTSNAKTMRQDFRLKMEHREVAGEAAQIDPGLRLDLLARLKNVNVGRGDRSLFDFASEPPKPRLPEPPIKLAAATRRPLGPEPPPPPPPPPAPPVKQPAPPLPFKFYGMLTSKSGGPKKAFLLEGEEIYTPAEGETVRKRYKVIRVGLNSVVIEDLDFKEQQSLVITEEPGG